MRLTDQMCGALKVVQEALDADVSNMPMPLNYAHLAQAWYEAKFGHAVRNAIAHAERGGW